MPTSCSLTNQLTIWIFPSKEILAQALEQYPGTLFFVSHDRDFLNRLATRVIDLTPHGIHSYTGDFDDYLYQINLAKEQANAAEKQHKHKQKKQGPAIGIDKHTLDVRKQASKLLEQVDRLERSIEEHRAKLGDFEYGTKPL